MIWPVLQATIITSKNIDYRKWAPIAHVPVSSVMACINLTSTGGTPKLIEPYRVVETRQTARGFRPFVSDVPE